MNPKHSLIILFLFLIIVIAGLFISVFSHNKDSYPSTNDPSVIIPQSTTTIPIVINDSTESFSFKRKILHDSLGNSVPMLIFTGSQDLYEPIVFSMGLYGDHTVSGYKSFKEYGLRIGAGAYPFSVLPDWAKSPISSEPKEYATNIQFRSFLVDNQILTTDFDVVDPHGSLVFYMGEYNDTVYIVHESSHVLYNNIPKYESSANEVYASLSNDTKSCITRFLEYQQYNVEDLHVLRDEFTAYLTEGSILGCINLNKDINNDTVVSASEQYLFDSMESLY